MDPQVYCQDIASKSGSSFYYSFLFLPKAQKQAMVALYAYCREIDDCVDEIKDKHVATTKINWWADETLRMFEGKAQHPITKALAVHLKTFPWPKEYFLELIRGMRVDLDGPMFETFDDLEDYCYCVASCVGLLSTYVFGFKNQQTLTYAKHLGKALQLINIIRDLGEDLRRSRIYLPEEELCQYGLQREKLLSFGYDDKALKPLLSDLAQRARAFYKLALDTLPLEDRKAQKSGLIMADIYLRLLDVIEEEDFKVLNQKIKLTPARKIWQAIKTSRKEKKQCKRTQ